MAPVAQFSQWTDEERETVGYLLTAAARSSESTLLLTAYGQVWDAELVLRSVVEGTLKLAYLLESESEFKQRYHEYAEDLFRIALLKDHQKAQEVLDAVPETSGPEWRPIRDRLLPPSEKDAYAQQYSSATRSALERKWGFTGIIATLTRSSSGPFSTLGALALMYSNASHLIHADWVGISMPMEREYRSDDRRHSIHLAHLARLISDTLMCLQVRMAVGYRFVRHDLAPVVDASARISVLLKELDALYGQWMQVEYVNMVIGDPA